MNNYNRKLIAESDTFENFIVYQKAHEISGLDWNYFIAQYLSKDLHVKFLPVDAYAVKDILPDLSHILTYISNGYFTLAAVMASSLPDTLPAEIIEIRDWLVTKLAEADDTEVEAWQK